MTFQTLWIALGTLLLGVGWVIAGNDSDVVGNRCYDNGQSGGVRVKGTNNRVRNNIEHAL